MLVAATRPPLALAATPASRCLPDWETRSFARNGLILGVWVGADSMRFSRVALATAGVVGWCCECRRCGHTVEVRYVACDVSSYFTSPIEHFG
jgi:hypothetical protein